MGDMAVASASPQRRGEVVGEVVGDSSVVRAPDS